MIITLPGQTRSKKNSKRILGRGKRKWIGTSELYMKWAQEAILWVKNKDYQPWVGDYPIEIHFFTYRENKRRFDWDNIIAGSLDILQQTKIIKQDDMEHVVPVIAGWTINYYNPHITLLLKPCTKQYFRDDLCKFK